MRRSDHPSRPSAITCCRFSALKTLPIPAAGVQPTAQVNISAPGAALAGFQVSINGRFWVSTEVAVLSRLPRAGSVSSTPDVAHHGPERVVARPCDARATRPSDRQWSHLLSAGAGRMVALLFPATRVSAGGGTRTPTSG